jgi:DUF971 family protein
MIPDAIEVNAGHLRLRWPDGDSLLSAALLRGACRCAHCRAGVLNGKSLPRHTGVAVMNVQPVGRYALQLTFSDGHARGIYPWGLLRELGSVG